MKSSNLRSAHANDAAFGVDPCRGPQLNPFRSVPPSLRLMNALSNQGSPDNLTSAYPSGSSGETEGFPLWEQEAGSIRFKGKFGGN